MPKVLITLYSQDDTLGEMIRMVLKQLKKKYPRQVVIIDDNSDDPIPIMLIERRNQAKYILSGFMPLQILEQYLNV